MKLANIPKTARAITLFAAVVLALAALWPGAANAAGPRRRRRPPTPSPAP